jgi:hypothetical protein
VLDGQINCTNARYREKINRCRLFLQATTIANITNQKGTEITDYAWGKDTNLDNNPRRSKHEWPRQQRPGPKSWNAWRAALKRFLSIDGKSQRLRTPLGHWTVTPSESRQIWHYNKESDANISTSTGQIVETKHKESRVPR